MGISAHQSNALRSCIITMHNVMIVITHATAVATVQWFNTLLLGFRCGMAFTAWRRIPRLTSRAH